MRRKGQNKRASILRSAGSIVVDALESRRFFDVVLFYDGDWGASQAQNPGVIGDPVGVSNGVLTLNTTDIQSTDFGTPWGVSSSWGNQPGLSKTSDDVGNGWVINQNPQIFHS